MKSLFYIAILASAFLPHPSAFSADPLLPDPSLTPGAVFPVTVEQLAQPGYANGHGGHGGVRNVPASEKRAVFIAYFGAVPARPGAYEVDHLISLELGGSNDPKNLWPQSYTTQPWNSHIKDRLEDWMAASMRHCLAAQGHAAATALLALYQREIAEDWIAAYRKYLPGKIPPGGEEPAPAPRPAPTPAALVTK